MAGDHRNSGRALPGPLTGAGETDCTLVSPHWAAGSKLAEPARMVGNVSDGALIAGPLTSELVGMVAGLTGLATGALRRICFRFWVLASRAVSDERPKVLSMSAKVEVCSKGPVWMTCPGVTRSGTTMAG